MSAVKHLKKNWYWIKWVISILLLALVFYQIDFEKFRESLGLVTWWFYPASFAIFLIGQWISTYRWQMFLPQHPFMDLFKLNLMSQFYAFLFPSSLTGDVAKVVQIDKSKGGTSNTVASVFLDRAFGFVALLLLMVLSFEMCSVDKFSNFKIINALLIAASIVFLVLLRFFNQISFLKNLEFSVLDNYPRILKLFKGLKSTLSESSSMLSNHSTLWINLLAAIVFQLVLASNFLLLDYLFSWGLNIFDYVLISGVTQIAMLLPISAGGIGLRDVSFVALMMAAGIERETAVAGMTISYPVRIAIILLGYTTSIKGIKNRKQV